MVLVLCWLWVLNGNQCHILLCESYTTLWVLFVIFGLLEGAGLAGIFMAYSLWAVYWAFLSTSILFVGLVFTEKVLDVDVTKMGPVLMVGLVSLIVVSLVNMFLQSPMINYLISLVGIVIFSGLVIYNMRQLRQMALMNDDRVEIIMGLSLYLDFINLFLFILRLVGSRD